MATHAPARWQLILSFALAVALPLAVAPAQSYPKLMTNGNGLALTKFSVEERVSGNWLASPSLRQGVDYRLVFRFTNYFPNTVSYGSYVSDIIRLSFEAQLSGALFYPSDAYSGSGTKWLNGYDAQGLTPTQSKTYYQHFRWNGPPVATPLSTWNVVFGGAEVHWLPKQSGPIRPS